ncbi:putative acyl-CoA synthetase [Mycobacterium xenopi 3993]|nr:putative acyl-CoA synthetase [Mycobacterium xenopi 3993]
MSTTPAGSARGSRGGGAARLRRADARRAAGPRRAHPRRHRRARELHIVDALPMRGIGKVDRQALARRLGGGQ